MQGAHDMCKTRALVHAILAAAASEARSKTRLLTWTDDNERATHQLVQGLRTGLWRFSRPHPSDFMHQATNGTPAWMDDMANLLANWARGRQHRVGARPFLNTLLRKCSGHGEFHDLGPGQGKLSTSIAPVNPTRPKPKCTVHLSSVQTPEMANRVRSTNGDSTNARGSTGWWAREGYSWQCVEFQPRRSDHRHESTFGQFQLGKRLSSYRRFSLPSLEWHCGILCKKKKATKYPARHGLFVMAQPTLGPRMSNLVPVF